MEGFFFSFVLTTDIWQWFQPTRDKFSFKRLRQSEGIAWDIAVSAISTTADCFTLWIQQLTDKTQYSFRHWRCYNSLTNEMSNQFQVQINCSRLVDLDIKKFKIKITDKLQSYKRNKTPWDMVFSKKWSTLGSVIITPPSCWFASYNSRSRSVLFPIYNIV